MEYNASEHAARGYVVATFGGSIIDRGPIADLEKFMAADTLHCDVDDEAELRRLVDKLTQPARTVAACA